MNFGFADKVIRSYSGPIPKSIELLMFNYIIAAIMGLKDKL
jgi:hypothetical protein